MFKAEYYDGLSARAELVWVQIKETHILISVDGNKVRYALADVEVQPKLGATKRMVDLPDGARLEADNIDALEAAIPSKSAGFWHFLHVLENSLGWVIISLVGAVFAGWLFLQHGVPKLSEYVAKATPPSMEVQLGEQVLKGLDHKFGYFSATKTPKDRQAKIASALDKLCLINDCPAYQLNFRDGGLIGANAFALPGGIMVVTDGLVELAKDDNEVVAVLAHELGHVSQRHAFRQSMQGTLAGLVLAAITGDVSMVGAGLPAALMQMRYSRQHELEADHFALTALQKACLPPRAFADILFRLQKQPQQLGGKKDKGETDAGKPAEVHNPISDILSTHPNTIARIKPFLSAKQDCE